MRTRAFRRTQDVQRKLRAVQVLKSRFEKGREPTAEEIGRTASVHGRDCSCWMCGNPRKYFGQKTLQEQALESIDSVLRDVI
jgi:hypothetical protein